MKFLLSNDDGIHAPGLSALYKAASRFGEVLVVAPAEEASAAGHSISLRDSISCERVDKNGEFFGWAVGGTPADCMKLALCELMQDDPPDLVLSGINLGSNTGISVLYSGTVSAASEAVILGVPGIAISLCTYENPNWDAAEEIASRIINLATTGGMPAKTLLNVNIPNRPLDKLQSFKIAKMGESRFIEKFHKYYDREGRLFYKLDGELKILDESPKTDVKLVESGHVALTPIHFDLTSWSAFSHFESWAQDVSDKKRSCN